MSPTSSSRPFAGRNALSATPRTTSLPSALRRLSARPSSADRLRTAFYSRKREPSPKLARVDGWPMPCRQIRRPRAFAAGMVAAGMGSAPTPAPCSPRGAALALGGLRRRRAPGRGRALRRSFSLDVDRRLVPGQAADRRARHAQARGREHGDRAVPDLAVTVETAPAPGRRRRRSRSARPPTTRRSRRAPARSGSSTTARPAATRPTRTPGRSGRSARASRARSSGTLTAVEAGRYTVAWRLAPALEGDVVLRRRPHGGSSRSRSPTSPCPRG